MTVLKHALTILNKDLRVEAKTGDILISTTLFAVLVAVVASFSFYVDVANATLVAPGVLWIAITFAGVLSIGRSWSRERDHGAMKALLMAPIPRPSIYLGKAAGSLLFLLAVEAVLLPLVGILFNLDMWAGLDRILLFMLLGTIGFVAAGTLFSVMTVRSSARDLVLSVVLFPLMTPALLSAVAGTREVLLGATFDESLGWFYLIIAFDAIFVIAGLVMFESLASD